MKKLIKFIFGSFLKRWRLHLLKLPDNLQLSGSRTVLELNDLKPILTNNTLLENSPASFFKTISLIEKHTMVRPEVLASLYDQVRYLELNGIEGDFVECGVWKGGAVGLMAAANMEFGKKRRNLHLFDAFDDICEPNPVVDGERAMNDVIKLAGVERTDIKGQLKPVKGIYDSMGGHGTIDECRELLFKKIKYSSQHVFFYKGWFQDTMPVHASSIEKIALLRLDSDWYESTKVSLTHLFGKVIAGGFVVIDDYGAYQGCKKAVDEFLREYELKKYLIRSSFLNEECYFFIR
jgi:O-methyltransferase